MRVFRDFCRTFGALALKGLVCSAAAVPVLWCPPAAATVPATLSPDATVRAASPTIDRANAEWEEAIRSGDAEVMARPYAEDGLFILPDGNAVRGRAAIREMYAHRAPGVHVLEAHLHSGGRVAPAPGVVYEWGDAAMRVQRADGTTAERTGRYLTVWQLDPSGAWTIVRNIAF